VNDDDDLGTMRARYARRARTPGDRYAPNLPDVQARVTERRAVTQALLARHLGPHALAALDVLEVGCGGGANLLEWLALGVPPERLVGNELLPERFAAARAALPAAVRLLAGDARRLSLPEASFDIVQQSTVFTPILDDNARVELAAAMWRWVRPGGAVLWYDFTVDNPRNPDVRGVPLARLRQLFPGAQIDARRVTLAPPLARALGRIHPSLIRWAAALPLLRTHVLAWVGKPAARTRPRIG
jgi:SAM-dependent methyltransferase